MALSDMVTRAARYMWRKHADEPLQVGKFKEPTDYREYERLGEPAREMLRDYARVALLAALDPTDDTLALAVAARLAERDPGATTDWNVELARASIAALKRIAQGET